MHKQHNLMLSRLGLSLWKYFLFYISDLISSINETTFHSQRNKNEVKSVNNWTKHNVKIKWNSSKWLNFLIKRLKLNHTKHIDELKKNGKYFFTSLNQNGNFIRFQHFLSFSWDFIETKQNQVAMGHIKKKWSKKLVPFVSYLGQSYSFEQRICSFESVEGST